MLKHIVMWQLAEQAAGQDKAANLAQARKLLEGCANLVPGMRRLEVAGLKDVTADAQVQSIADAAHLTPARVYDLVRNAGQANAADGKGEHGPRGRSAGGGPGWKTLAQFCTDEGLNLEAAQARLTGRGFKFSADQTLREIAVNNGFDRPYALLEILRQ